jgi:hypothetical protein
MQRLQSWQYLSKEGTMCGARSRQGKVVTGNKSRCEEASEGGYSCIDCPFLLVENIVSGSRIYSYL